MSTVGAAHNVRVLGSGETTVVLGHGFGSDQSIWKHLVPHLVNQYRVLLYDDMGAGTTNPDYFDFNRYATVEGYANDLIAILEEFNVRKCIYVSHSLSAMAAATASISRPDLFHKLIMVSSTPSLLNTVDYHGGFEQEELDQLCYGMETDYKSLIPGFAKLVIGAGEDSVVVHEFTQTALNIRPDIALSVIRTITTLDMIPVLPRVTVPCHIIQSSKDFFVPLAVGEYLHQNLGGKSIVEVMSTEGHLPHLSAPEVTIPVLLRHIQQDIVDA